MALWTDGQIKGIIDTDVFKNGRMPYPVRRRQAQNRIVRRKAKYRNRKRQDSE